MGEREAGDGRYLSEMVYQDVSDVRKVLLGGGVGKYGQSWGRRGWMDVRHGCAD